MSTEMWMSDSGERHPQVVLQRRIWDELRAEPGLDTGALSVELEGLVVTLAGSVPNYPSKLAVQRAAERIAGIRTVVNEITVRLREPDARPDSALTAAAANALVWDARVAHGKLCAYVLDGWVTLAGTVGHGAERAAAANAVENLTGIRGVTNQIVVVPADSATVVARAQPLVADVHRVRGGGDDPVCGDGILHRAAARAGEARPRLTRVPPELNEPSPFHHRNSIAAAVLCGEDHLHRESGMRINEAGWDRALRVVLGVAILYLGWAGIVGGVLGLAFKIVGFLPLITGIVGWCPAYALFGASTCPRTPAGLAS